MSVNHRPIVTRARARHQVGEGDDVRRFLQVRITRRAHKYFRCVERVLTPRTCRATSCSCTSSSTSSCCASPRFLSSPPYITFSYQVEGCTVSWMGDHIIRCFPQVRGRAARPRARGQQGRPAGRAAARGALGLRVLGQVPIIIRRLPAAQCNASVSGVRPEKSWVSQRKQEHAAIYVRLY
jgi:hypothetical protein